MNKEHFKEYFNMNNKSLNQILKQKIKHEKWKVDSSQQIEISYHIDNGTNKYSYVFPAIEYFKKYGIRICLFIEILSNISDVLTAIDEMKQH